MIDGLRPYDQYRPAAAQHLPEVPGHWQIRRLKTMFQEVDRRTKTGSECLLSLRQDAGLVDHHARGGRPIPPESLVGYKLTEPGEIVMNRMRAASGLFAATPTPGLVSPDYAVLRPRTAVALDFFVRLFRTPTMTTIFRAESRGLGTGQSGFLRLYTERFGALVAPVPPLDEQRDIAKAARHVDNTIGRYVALKQQLLRLLIEREQAAARAAARTGIAASAFTRPSGIDWIGDVPSHWEVVQLRHIARIGNGSTPARSNPDFWADGDYPWLNSGAINRSPISSSDQFVTDVALARCHLPRVPPMSLLMAITGQGKTRGTVAILAIESTINQQLAYLVPRHDRVDVEYLHLILSSAYEALRALSDNAGSTKGALTCGDIGHFKVPLPPIDEQRRIVSAVGDTLDTLRRSRGDVQREIDLARELRTRVNDDLLLGRLDARRAAASLPDLPREDAPLEPDELDDLDASGVLLDDLDTELDEVSA